MNADTAAPQSTTTAVREYPALRKAGIAFIATAVVFSAVYYRYELLPMALSTLRPFLGLLVVGFVVGLVFRRSIFVPCFLAWWVVLIAAMVRRSSLSGIPLGSQLFDGALLGYPEWSLRVAQCLRLGVYFWALWLGAGIARRLRRSGNPA